MYDSRGSIYNKVSRGLVDKRRSEDDLPFASVHQFADIDHAVAERRVQFEFESLNTRGDRCCMKEKWTATVRYIVFEDVWY